MPIPLIPIIAGGGAYALYKKLTKEDSSSPPILTAEEKCNLTFEISLIVASALSDGELQKEEEKFLLQTIEEHKKKYPLDMEYFTELSEILRTPPSFKDLSARWKTTNKDKKIYKDLITEVHKLDQEIKLPEEVFLYRCALLFDGLPDQEIFMFENNTNITHEKSVINYLSSTNVPDKYLIESILPNVMYVIHPAHTNQNTQELIPIEDLYEESFLTSQDAELVNVARIAGAKKVIISADSAQTTEDLEKIQALLKSEKLNIKSKVDIFNALAQSESKVLEIKFQGNETSFFNYLKSLFIKPERAILKRSTWLQHDADLVEFVRSCFSENKVTFFSKEISTTLQSNAIHSVKLAADFNLIKVTGKAEVELSKKIKRYEKQSKTFRVEF